jgi:aminopeptidase YwaD
MGSDHDVYQDSSFGIPAIYLNDWPDRYIHTNFDSAANIDTTKLKRAAFIGAASGYFLAGMSNESLKEMQWVKSLRDARLTEEFTWRLVQLSREGRENLNGAFTEYVTAAENSPGDYVSGKGAAGTAQMARGTTARGAGGEVVLKRRTSPKGPLAVFGYDYFAEHGKAAGVATAKLLSHEGLWGGGEAYAYEVLNFANGKRNAQEIRDAVSAEYGPVPLELVLEYLQALEKIGVVERVK